MKSQMSNFLEESWPWQIDHGEKSSDEIPYYIVDFRYDNKHKLWIDNL